MVSAAGDVNSVHHHSHRQKVNLAMAVAWPHRHGRQSRSTISAIVINMWASMRPPAIAMIEIDFY